MKEICSGGIIYFKDNKDIFFLLIKSSKTGWWVFPKGHIMKDEDLISTAIREIYEEVGLSKLQRNENYHEVINFTNSLGSEKEVHHWLFETFSKEINLSSEHIDYKWLKFEEAHNLVDYENQKRLLKKANELLNYG